MCKVKVTATLEEHSIHVEESSRPGSLLYAAEGADPGPVERQAWNHIRRHPEDPARSLHLNLQAALPGWRLRQIERGFLWLVRKIIQEPWAQHGDGDDPKRGNGRRKRGVQPGS